MPSLCGSTPTEETWDRPAVDNKKVKKVGLMLPQNYLESTKAAERTTAVL
jgi:hypothetical protein